MTRLETTLYGVAFSILGVIFFEQSRVSQTLVSSPFTSHNSHCLIGSCRCGFESHSQHGFDTFSVRGSKGQSSYE